MAAPVNNAPPAPVNNEDNPYYMHANESPAAVLVSNVLTSGGENYNSWARSMTVSLSTKNKIGFVDGTIPRPLPNTVNSLAWNRCNSMVLSWLMHALDSEVAQSVLWMNVASEVWAELRQRYYQGDVFRICEVQEEIYTLKQGDVSITSYFTRLKGLWQELENYRPIPSCTCAVQCICQLLPTIKKYRDSDYVIRFLRGLNEQYSAVRSQIMLSKPLPDINTVFSMLIQQERQLNSEVQEPRVIANAVESRSTGRGRGNRGQTNNSGGRKGGGRGRSNKMCSFCYKEGHTVDVCYRKHGYPPNYFKRNEERVINNCTQDDEELEDDDGSGSINNDVQKDTTSSSFSFTVEQRDALLVMLQGQNSSHTANQVSTSTKQNNAGIVCAIAQTVSNLSNWILDTGATDHVCQSRTNFQCLRKIKPVLVRLPDGSQMTAHMAGTIVFSTQLFLHDVLYIPKFTFNLISVSKLAK